VRADDTNSDVAMFTRARLPSRAVPDIERAAKDDRAVIMEYAKRMHLAGFNLQSGHR
jgi:hypothetical protein